MSEPLSQDFEDAGGETAVATKLAVHEAVCAERWKQSNERLERVIGG